MRTILYGICLFIDNMKTEDRVFISNGDCEEESRIVERQRKSVRDRERGSTLRKRRDGIGYKMSH